MTPELEDTVAVQHPLAPLSEATRASLLAVRRAQEAARERARRETARARIGAGMVVGVIVAGVVVLGPSLKRRLNAARAATATSSSRLVGSAGPSKPAHATVPHDLAAAPATAPAIPVAAATGSSAPETSGPATGPLAGAEPAGGTRVDVPSLTAAGAASNAACEETFQQHRWQISIDECTRLFEVRPTDATLALRIAHAHHARGHLADAGTWANRALALDPSLAEAFVLVARAENHAGRADAALQAYRQYLTLAPRGWHAAEARAAVRGHAKPSHAHAAGGRAAVQVAATE